MDFETIPPPLDPRVRKVKRAVLILLGFVLLSLLVSATFATIHLATDRPVKDVLGFGKSEG